MSWTVHSMLIGLMFAVSAACVAWYCGRQALEITYVTLADGRRRERRLPMMYRILLPFAPNFNHFFRQARFDRARANANRSLVSAGFEGLLVPEEFLSLKVLMPAVVGPLLIMLYHVLMLASPDRLGAMLSRREPLFGLLLVAWLYVQPSGWLRRAVKIRHKEIERSLPFVLDLLTLSVEAGLDFMTAIKRIIDRRLLDALGEELIRVFRQVQLGKTRREALRDMAERVGQLDIRSVVNALVQADELGVSIGAILRIQADQMRERRFQHAEKIANEAPVKMLLPLIGFIFPAVFIVLLGPIVLKIMESGL